MTRQKTYVLTAIAAGLFVALCWIFADGLFSFDHFFAHETELPNGSTISYIFEGSIWTYLMIAAIIGAGLYQARQLPADGIAIREKVDETTPGQVHDPRNWRLLLGNVYFAVLWMPIRFFVGLEWLAAGEHKVRSDAWMDGGTALVSGNPEAPGFWERIVSTDAAPNPNYTWFSDFIQWMIDNEWQSAFAKMIAVGEVLVGVGLIVGALVGISAFFGTLMNFNFMLAGTASSNPVLFGLGVFLVLGWKVAGYWGLDRYLLPILGTPWKRREAGNPAPPPVAGSTPKFA